MSCFTGRIVELELASLNLLNKDRMKPRLARVDWYLKPRHQIEDFFWDAPMGSPILWNSNAFPKGWTLWGILVTSIMISSVQIPRISVSEREGSHSSCARISDDTLPPAGGSWEVSEAEGLVSFMPWGFEVRGVEFDGSVYVLWCDN